MRNEEVNHHPLDDAAVGDGFTITIHTDAHAYTILRRSRNTIVGRRDEATMTNPEVLRFVSGGFAAHCENTKEVKYAYRDDPCGATKKITRRVLPNGRVIWKEAGARTRSPGFVASAGRREHYDYNY
jgi:hypothetical protein